MPSTELVAWYGAVVATVVFLFDVWKWARHRAALRVTIRPNVCYHDGEVEKVEKTDHGETGTLKIYFHIEVTNVGELPTTLMGVSSTTRFRGVFERLIAWRKKKLVGEFANYTFTAHYGKQPPFVIGPGEVWSCRIPNDIVLHLCVQGRRPKLEVTAACWPRPRLFLYPLRGRNAN